MSSQWFPVFLWVRSLSRSLTLFSDIFSSASVYFKSKEMRGEGFPSSFRCWPDSPLDLDSYVGDLHSNIVGQSISFKIVGDSLNSLSRSRARDSTSLAGESNGLWRGHQRFLRSLRRARLLAFFFWSRYDVQLCAASDVWRECDWDHSRAVRTLFCFAISNFNCVLGTLCKSWW